MRRLEQRPAGKQPMSRLAALTMIGDDDEERPNLAAYFDDFPTDIADHDRIKICRAYASYLASQLPAKPKAPKRSKKSN